MVEAVVDELIYLEGLVYSVTSLTELEWPGEPIYSSLQKEKT
jgi:hypothetical protein